MIKEQTEHGFPGHASEYERVELNLDPAAFNLIQVVVEDMLIRILKYARLIVVQTTKGPKEDSKSRRNLITGRDIDTAVQVLRECSPMLVGGPRTVLQKSKLTAAAKAATKGRVSTPRSGAPRARAKANTSKRSASAKSKGSRSRPKAKPAKASGASKHKAKRAKKSK